MSFYPFNLPMNFSIWVQGMYGEQERAIGDFKNNFDNLFIIGKIRIML
uniref:Uncharacterized protein n=1 Tax=Rhizophora mucronata TaxID=61149 RepID=A0A2P2NA37_RHIMU